MAKILNPTPNAGEEVEQQEHIRSDMNAKWTDTLEGS